MPWQGVETVWFNDTLFKIYGAKTPHDYIKEGNWTWETLVQCMKDTTKDVDGDGKFDIYGMDLRGINRMMPNFLEDENGKVINIIDTERQRAFIELIYNGMKEGYIQALNYTYTRVDYPRPAMFIGDGGVNDYSAFYDDRLKNGEILMRAPTPIRSKEDPYHLNCITSIYWAMGAATDEPEAAWDLFKYITLTGMTFHYDGYYEGLHTIEKPKYYEEGQIKGVSEWGKAWNEYLPKGRAINQKKMDEVIIPNLTKDQTDVIFPLLNKPFAEDPYMCINGYTGITAYLGTAANYNNPPATMIATLKPTLDSQIATYNDLYVY
jgi:ABC-type glycerol-3-phosphate transport system substrate-binding protein